MIVFMFFFSLHNHSLFQGSFICLVLVSLSLIEDFPCLLIIKSRALHASMGRVFTVGWFNCTIRQGTCILLFVFSHGLDSPENILSICCLEGVILAVSLSGAMLGRGGSECLHSLFANTHLIPLFSI